MKNCSTPDVLKLI